MGKTRARNLAPVSDPAATRAIFVPGLRLVWRYVRREPATYAVSLVGATLFAAAAVGTTMVLGWATDEVIVPAFSSGVTEQRVRAGALALFAMGVLRGISIMLRRFFAFMTTFRTAARLRREVADTYLDAPLSFHRSRPTGELLAHADADILAATEVLNPFPFSVGVIVLIVFAVVSLVIVDPVLTLIAVLLFPTLALINRRYSRLVHAPAAVVQHRIGTVSAIAHESFDGALIVKTLGREQHEVDRMEAAAEDLRAARLDVARIRAAFEPAIDALPNVGIIVLLLIGSWQISLGRIEAGDLVQAMALFGILAFPVRVVGFFLQEIPRAVVAAERLDEVRATPPAPTPHAAEAEVLPAGPLPVRFDHVRFGYDPDVPVLADLDLTVAPGEIVAIVGSTGSGKTTVCDLLAHQVVADAGVVSVGGVDVTRADPEALRRAVALVFQETFLFAESLAENIALGADVDDEAIRAAAAVARVDEFIGGLPAAYETVVGERGVTLSGGQRQRVALARALVRSPQVLVLDDATSAVDPVVEAEILARLRSTLRTTTLIVAHRVSTIELADRVLYLDGGRVAASGTHRQLLAVPGYERIVRAYERGAVA